MPDARDQSNENEDPMAKKTRQGSKRPYDDLVAGISSLARQFRDAEQRARELGIFTNDRELLQCSGCGLSEDVAFDGRLFTYQSADRTFRDTGLRFQEIDSRHFHCPPCHSILEIEPESISVNSRKSSGKSPKRPGNAKGRSPKGPNQDK